MARRIPWLTVLVSSVLVALPRAQEAVPPNVLFILADDLGWADLACYGSRFHETPNIDRLAASGLRFTQAYGQPLCSPARAALLSGLDPARLGITQSGGHHGLAILRSSLPESAPASEPLLEPVPATRLDTAHVTLAEALRGAGLRTAHFGKWHLGAEPYSPLQHGYEIDVPHTPHPGPMRSYFAPFIVWSGKGESGDHLEDLLAEEAAAWLDARPKEPFYLAYWAFEVHAPWQAKADQVEHYRAKARAEPCAAQRHPLYAGMVRSLDEAVGRLVQALERNGLRERTLIVFTSDNGAVAGASERPSMPEEFRGVPLTSNAPLRGGKGSLYEGGVRVPLIVSWPGWIEPGRTSAALVTLADWYPTLLELLGIAPRPGQEFDGLSFVRALSGGPSAREAVFFHRPHGSQAASSVRMGDWKLIRSYRRGAAAVRAHELYDLATDLGESRDLADQQPGRVAELDALLAGHLARIGALLPQPNPAFSAPPGRR